MRRRALDFQEVYGEALVSLPAILARWLPGGRTEGGEYVACNPTRADRRRGFFKVNIRSGRWADFAPDACGNVRDRYRCGA